MKAGKNWPRTDYLSPDLNVDAFAQMLAAVDFDGKEEALQVLSTALPDLEKLCKILAEARESGIADLAELIDFMVLADNEIIGLWLQKRNTAANSGTWMHAMLEHTLNGFQIQPGVMETELGLAMQFLAEHADCTVFRTEWAIHAPRENLAGSIDLVLYKPSLEKYILVDWKRSEKLSHKYSSFGKTMQHPLEHVPDCQGEQYRLQLNIYRWILEAYYDVSVSEMYVVCTHPVHSPRPFLDLVPDMQEAVSILMQHVRDSDLADEEAQGFRALEENVSPTIPFEVVLPSHSGAEMHTQDELAVALGGLLDEDDAQIPSAAKKRRLMPGAAESIAKFSQSFAKAAAINADELDTCVPDVPQDGLAILTHTRAMLQELKNRFPACAEQSHRIILLAAHIAESKIPDRPMLTDLAAVAWLVEGERHMRVHKGFLWIFNGDGSFLPFSGIPPEAVLHRLGLFFKILEGSFKRLKESVRREHWCVANSIMADIQNFETEEDYYRACIEAAQLHARSDNIEEAEARVEGLEEDADGSVAVMDQPQRRGRAAAKPWTIHAAEKAWKLCQCLKAEFMHTKIIALIVEWCETEDQRRPAVCYTDSCFVYDADPALHVKQVKKSPSNNCYISIPHALLDPVLEENQRRLYRFYERTFWANHDVFICCQAAIALAKRGLNIDRCFIGISPGGVGQSLFSQHIAEMYGHNHAFFDPNIWHIEEELRKQVESFARCFVITGQEAPESSKKMHLDLFKKTMSGDGVMGRKPYGYTTRMFSIIGWKRLEVNRLMHFVGVNTGNFNSIFRRAFIYVLKARFIHEKFLAKYPDHELDGIFAADYSLSKYIPQSQCCLAGLRFQWAFEREYNLEDCYRVIEDYVNGGDGYLTEDMMRAACNLPVRQRHADVGDAGIGNLLAGDKTLQEEETRKQSEWSSFQIFLMSKMLDMSMETLSFHEFKTKISLKDRQAPNMPKDQLWDEMLRKDIVREAIVTGKTSKARGGRYIPRLDLQKRLEDICDVKKDGVRLLFEEQHDVARLQLFATGCAWRSLNVEVMQEYYAAVQKGLQSKKAGRKATSEVAKINSVEDSSKKIKEREDSIGRIIRGEIRPPNSPRVKRRKHGKRAQEEVEDEPSADIVHPQGHVTAKTVEYHFCDDPSYSVRSRRYGRNPCAQTMSRSIQAHVVDEHSIDLDIQNCAFTLLFQILQQASPSPPMTDDLQNFLEELAWRRQDVIARLPTTNAEGKELLNVVLNGGNAPNNLQDHPDIQKLQQISVYFRWLACNLLYDDYMSLKDNPKKTFPTASMLSLMWTAVEDWILDVWSEYVLSLSPQPPAHLSLHFDGLRISKSFVSDESAFIASCEQHIAEKTGFKVKIIRKHLKCVFDCFRDDAETCTLLTNVPEVCMARGNCIPCSMWHAMPFLRSGIEAALQDPDKKANQDFGTQGCREYGQTASLLGANLMCCVGLPPERVKSFLLHSEDSGMPHCVAVQTNADGTYYSVFDGNNVRRLSSQAFRSAIITGTDGSTVVSFWQRRGQEKINLEAALLQLRAGASSTSSSDDEEAQPLPREFLIDEDGVMSLSDKILDALCCEVEHVLSDLSKYIQRQDGKAICPFCPFRSFKQKRLLAHHIHKHHTKEKQCVCSGTKQKKIIYALHDYAAAMQETPRNSYLQDSAKIIRNSVHPPLSDRQNNIDKELRLVLRSSGPAYINAACIDTDCQLRRVRNIYYDHSFADMLLQEIILHHGQDACLTKTIVSLF